MGTTNLTEVLGLAVVAEVLGLAVLGLDVLGLAVLVQQRTAQLL